jgi:hypothetical protein
VSETASCPHCGSPGRESGFGPLYQEVRRIREIAESREAGDEKRRVAELTREVAELRATVARLRGSGLPS